MKVILGLSGGVDSAVALIKLLEQGYEVETIFMRNWDSSLNNDVLGNPNDFSNVCPQEQDYLDALDVANKYNVKLHRIDFVDVYWEKVFAYFLEEYKNNRTPNPDILCNSEIKFKVFLEEAFKLKADYIAMGHYARVVHNPEVKLYKAFDKNKDQSYFLSQLNKTQLSKALFPLGEMTKEEVRKIARENDIKIATKKDSTGICFIGERNFKEFLKNYLKPNPGDIKTLSGEVVGKHEGLMYHTIGQRKGLGIGGAGDAWYVVGKDIANNALLVSQGDTAEYLYSDRCIVNKINWLADDFKTLDCCAKFRYRSMDVKVRIVKINEDEFEVNYPDKAKAVTPGQAAVFYLGDELLGGGTINEVYLGKEKRMY